MIGWVFWVSDSGLMIVLELFLAECIRLCQVWFMSSYRIQRNPSDMSTYLTFGLRFTSLCPASRWCRLNVNIKPEQWRTSTSFKDHVCMLLLLVSKRSRKQIKKKKECGQKIRSLLDKLAGRRGCERQLHCKMFCQVAYIFLHYYTDKY